jgi:DNA-binding phage protein
MDVIEKVISDLRTMVREQGASNYRLAKDSGLAVESVRKVMTIYPARRPTIEVIAAVADAAGFDLVIRLRKKPKNLVSK